MIALPMVRVERQAIYEMADISHTTHANWIEERLLVRPPKGRLSQDEALGILLLAHLIRSLGSDHGRTVWRDIGAQIADADGSVDVIFEAAHLRATLARSDAELSAAVRGKGSVRVVTVEISAWRRGLARLAEVKTAARSARPSGAKRIRGTTGA
jgi:hypothetical protein